MPTLFLPQRSITDAKKAEDMPSTRREKGGEATAAAAAGGRNGVAAITGQTRLSRVSASVALESFKWTDDAIVEVSRKGSFISVGRSTSASPGRLLLTLVQYTNIRKSSVVFQAKSNS